MGTLYVVATPIGNLEDVTLRALRVLAEVPLIAAEDTRTTRHLLERHGITTPLVSYTDHNKRTRIPALLAHLERADLALVSEAGTPTISDPGEDLVAAAAAAGHRVVPVPGPSAVLVALSVSGLPTRRFLYLGFLPRAGGERRALLRAVARLPYTLVAFESPHRLRAALDDILAVLGDRPLAVCRELTKVHEEIYRGSVRGALAHFQEPRGEFTLVIQGASEPEPTADLAAALAEVGELVTAGSSARDAVTTAARRHGLPRRQLYEAWLKGHPAG
ncbi:MAG: 16S rRNA (cytidine(1402)-2'-O)-methyltransferase [Chloroflexota bacterium]